MFLILSELKSYDARLLRLSILWTRAGAARKAVAFFRLIDDLTDVMCRGRIDERMPDNTLFLVHTSDNVFL